jgi:predicted branched-subunit amino acid permease
MVTARDDLDDPVRFRRYWSCAGGLLLGFWVATIGVGSVLGPLLPTGIPLDAAAVAVLAGMLAPRLRTLRTAAIALAALLAAVAVPGGIGLSVGIVAGVVVGAVLDRKAS